MINMLISPVLGGCSTGVYSCQPGCTSCRLT